MFIGRVLACKTKVLKNIIKLVNKFVDHLKKVGGGVKSKTGFQLLDVRLAWTSDRNFFKS